MFRRKASLLLSTAVFLISVSSPSTADTIVKVGLGDTTPVQDVQLVNGVFGTVNSSYPQLFGAQFTNIDFVGGLTALTDILTGAQFQLANVALTGNALSTGGVVQQGTTGGTFNLWDNHGTLLLSGVLQNGAILGGSASTTGSYFNTTIARFVGGSLMAYVFPEPAGLSIALSNILSSGATGLRTVCGASGCNLANFTADATGIIEGSAVPEPFTAGLLISGLLAGAVIRRRHAA